MYQCFALHALFPPTRVNILQLQIKGLVLRLLKHKARMEHEIEIILQWHMLSIDISRFAVQVLIAEKGNTATY